MITTRRGPAWALTELLGSEPDTRALLRGLLALGYLGASTPPNRVTLATEDGRTLTLLRGRSGLWAACALDGVVASGPSEPGVVGALVGAFCRRDPVEVVRRSPIGVRRLASAIPSVRCLAAYKAGLRDAMAVGGETEAEHALRLWAQAEDRNLLEALKEAMATEGCNCAVGPYRVEGAGSSEGQGAAGPGEATKGGGVM